MFWITSKVLDVLFSLHDFCVGGCQTREGFCVSSTSEVVHNNLQSMLNSIVTNGSTCYGVDYTPSQTTTPSLSTMQYMELEKIDYTLKALITKSFTQSLDIIPIILCITCNANKSNIVLQVTCHLYSISMNYFLHIFWCKTLTFIWWKRMRTCLLARNFKITLQLGLQIWNH